MSGPVANERGAEPDAAGKAKLRYLLDTYLD
jgi:hypothetical protein